MCSALIGRFCHCHFDIDPVDAYYFLLRLTCLRLARMHLFDPVYMYTHRLKPMSVLCAYACMYMYVCVCVSFIHSFVHSFIQSFIHSFWRSISCACLCACVFMCVCVCVCFRQIGLFVCLSVCLYVCLSLCLSLSVCLSFCTWRALSLLCHSRSLASSIQLSSPLVSIFLLVFVSVSAWSTSSISKKTACKFS